MSRQNHNLEPQIKNLHITNKVVVVVAAPPSRTKVENAVNAALKKSTNYNKNNVKTAEGNARFNCPRPLGSGQNTNKNNNYNHGMQQNVPKNTFHQQQFNTKLQNPHGNTTKPQQQNCTTNIKALNQINLQLGGNSKPINHGDHKKTNNNQGTFRGIFKLNSSKNTFHQQQFNPKPQNHHGPIKPQQQSCTNIKVANQTNVQVGGNSKPIHRREPKKNNNNQGTVKTNSGNHGHSRNYKRGGNSQIVIKVNQTNVVINT